MGQKSELFSVGSHRETGERHTRTAPAKVSRRRDLIEIAIVLAGKWAPSALGLTKPLAGAGHILLAGALACGGIALIGIALRSVGPGYTVPLTRSWQYAIWALEQEFILQSIFFVRLEEVV